MGQLDGKVAIVTGAGRLRGIGRATAVALATEGADVVVTGTGRSPATVPEDEKARGWRDIESTAEQVRATGRRCLPLVGDVTDSAQVQRVVDGTLDTFGRVDILVNNAAFARGPDRVLVVEMNDAIFRRVLEVKVVGSYLFSKAVAKVLIRQNQGGSIVNLSSVAGRRGAARASAYNAANFAIHGFTQALAHELAPYQVRVNAVCPGLTDRSRMDDLGRGEAWQAAVARIPLGRHASDEDIAGVVTWLCTPAAALITGQHINVDGGLNMD
ncbi:MAG: SDR family oxidoreductase [Chloroflexi bacterium]|nr:SDR family oxidoreductase [Chloroflexota bacterium]